MPKNPFETPMKPVYGTPDQLSPLVRRLVCNNPGPFTHHGTNAYLVGTKEIGVIDPGPVNEDHLQAILEATRGQTIKWILMTHTHMDHSPNGMKLKELTGATTVAHPAITHDRGMEGWGNKMVQMSFEPDIQLTHGEKLETDEWTLEAVHTPGHAPDHLCLALPQENALFSGDHVMGWSTSIVAPPEGHMGDYLRTLTELMERGEQVFYPAHGGEITKPKRLIKSLLLHRHIRQQALLDCLKNGLETISEFLGEMYKDTEEELLPAARLSLLAQLHHLVEIGKVINVADWEADDGFEGRYKLIKS